MRGNTMEKSMCHPMTAAALINKAFAVLESVAALESALWDVFYKDFLDKCAEKSENIDREKEKNIVEY
jgi:hypothetical protein